MEELTNGAPWETLWSDASCIVFDSENDAM
jgi:hypothetical protein